MNLLNTTSLVQDGPVLPSPDANLRRNETADALNAAGFPIKKGTLATMATRGGGPPHRKWGAVVLYNWGETLKWAQDRLSPPRRSTSDTGQGA